MTCSMCGVAVRAEESSLHSEWHRRMDDAIQGLMDWRRAQTVPDVEFDGILQTGRKYESRSGMQFTLVGYRDNPSTWEYRELNSTSINYAVGTEQLRARIKKEIS